MQTESTVNIAANATSLDKELELRAHVRALLLQYALTHLATNYVTWTQDTVINVLSECLSYVPLTGPTDVTLPVDPLETLSRRWGLDKLDLLEERWKVENPEVVTYLKRQLPTGRGIYAAEQQWRSSHDDDYELFLLQRPISPMLTLRARKETPRPGKSAPRLPQTDDELLHYCNIAKAESDHPPDHVVNTDDALGNKLTIDPTTHRDVVTLIQSIPAMSSRSKEPIPTPHEAFLRAASPPIDDPEPAMLPLFPRDQRLGSRQKQLQQDSESFSTSLEAATNSTEPWLAPVQVKEEDEEDMANEHLVLVGGWEAFKTPSSPLTLGTPSLADTSSDIDELFSPSSPIPCTEELQPWEEYQIPRCEKIGGSRWQPKLLGENTNLAAFLSPLIPPSQANGARVVHSPKSRSSSPRTTITLSMLGQPPSIADSSPRAAGSQSRRGPRTDDPPSSDDSITFAVKAVERACGDRIGKEDPIDLILEEKLDEKDGLLMDIPNLRPPNEHTKDLLLPERLADLPAPGKSNKSGAQEELARSEPYRRCIRKAKGLGPLQIELSWIPFKYGRTIPTNEEVAGVENDQCPQFAKAIDLPQDEIVSKLAVLLDESMAFSSHPVNTAAAHDERVWFADDRIANTSVGFSYSADACLVLGRGDRRRLAGLRPLPEDEEENGSSDRENEDEPEALPSDHDRPVKRVRFQEPIDEPEAKPVVDMICDDSGVFMADHIEDIAKPDSDGYSPFSQLAYDSEGFDGPTTDGNLFLDMHPVYFDEYNFDISPQQYVLDPYALAWSAPSPSSPELPVEHCAPALHVAIEEDKAPCGLPPPVLPQEIDEMAGSLSSVVYQHLPDTFARPSHDQLTATDVVMRTDSFRTSATPALPALCARQSLAQFLAICGKGSLVQPASADPASSQPADHAVPVLVGVNTVGAKAAPQGTPAELLDSRTVLLQDDREPSSTMHRYMASMPMIQRRALVRRLEAYCAVELIDREHLGDDVDDVHIIMDCDTAAVFFSLEMLPSSGDALAVLLTRLSWRYTRLLVIFECYPSSWDYRGDRDFSDKPTASAWSPPVVKAVKKLRRDLSISEGVQTKAAATLVEYAFANSVEEAAAFVRLYGDCAEARDTTDGAVWGERLWLTPEERDGEYDLCGIPGMNLFAASLLLSQTSLEAFLEKSASGRLAEYGTLVGAQRIERFNQEMAHRLEIMQLPPSSPIDASASSSSLSSVPYIGDSDIGFGVSNADHQY